MAPIVACAILKALMTRVLFAIHCLVAVWRVVDVHDDKRFWFILVALPLLLVETLVTLIKRKGQEPKWFCPSFFIYLCGVVPSIWFLELDRLERHRNTNFTNPDDRNDSMAQALSSLNGMNIPIVLDPDMWVNCIEQSMLLLLIVGRWMLPKGDITRDQLSQLLFVYIGMASDIMELYYLFEEPQVLGDRIMGYVILGVWSSSLLQFTVVLTATKARKPRVAMNHTSKVEPVDADHTPDGCCGCCDMRESEIWSIMTMVFLQDGPFLTVRLYVTITFKLFSYNILFFTSKNALIIMLQFYRLVVICVDMRSKAKGKKCKVPTAADNVMKFKTDLGTHKEMGNFSKQNSVIMTEM